MLKIVVLQRGWVAVGRVKRDGDYVTMTDAAIIRRWGTNAGLGQLALEGPMPETILDRCPPIKCHALTIVLEMECREASWKGK